ncbi:uncharacterized protein BT62DRAFT_1009266 [Guyanagaster necrorhizus]|uniref:Uncharacterized protein n=1 Tax=Guyanagaster necrorhizus TaxID=856835 RepID=A0A9P8AR27_9AGAR|nr:uncharacterized protein BT62DRAFT_1009266 [Guyanagaster necrorhizus MCA 3950]KAG7443452.1 hypothetical protein BT62DRAFT_1009266 [Guyanagaster necrorhizus MCA 3950]
MVMVQQTVTARSCRLLAHMQPAYPSWRGRTLQQAQSRGRLFTLDNMWTVHTPHDTALRPSSEGCPSQWIWLRRCICFLVYDDKNCTPTMASSWTYFYRSTLFGRPKDGVRRLVSG